VPLRLWHTECACYYPEGPALFPMIVLACCFFAVLLVPILLFVVTYIFRQACVLCGLPRPSVATAAAVMLLIWVSKSVSEAVMSVIVHESCRIAGLPRWEAGIIFAFLFLPFDLLISSGLHASLMNVRFGKGIEVWFVQMLMYLAIALTTAVVCVIVYLAMN
jgi:hypothetical protein